MFKARERSSGEARIEELGVDIPHLESIGWGEYMDTNKLEIHTIDGNHESMLRHGQVEQMSRILSEKMK